MNRLEGMKVRFVPICNAFKATGRPLNEMPRPLTGTIVFVHSRHGWFRVQWNAGDTIQHECFKVCDIGRTVELVGRC